MTDLVIVCTGRAVDRGGAPCGDPCGRTFRRSGHATAESMAACLPWPPPVVPVDDATYVLEARAGGWSIGPAGDAICPRCRRPDPELAQICRELAHGLF